MSRLLEPSGKIQMHYGGQGNVLVVIKENGLIKWMDILNWNGQFYGTVSTREKALQIFWRHLGAA